MKKSLWQDLMKSSLPLLISIASTIAIWLLPSTNITAMVIRTVFCLCTAIIYDVAYCKKWSKSIGVDGFCSFIWFILFGIHIGLLYNLIICGNTKSIF